MAQQTINVGAAPNDGTGDPARTAFTKCNDNFTELYSVDAGKVAKAGDTMTGILTVAETTGENIILSGSNFPAIHLVPAAGATKTSYAYQQGDLFRIGSNTTDIILVDLAAEIVALKGAANGSSAATGYVGEYVESSVPVGSAVALTTNVAANITSISLTAGDWDVQGHGVLTGNASTLVTVASCSVSATSATLDQTAGRWPSVIGFGAALFNFSSNIQVNTGVIRMSLASTTTIYLVGFALFTTSTCSAYGRLKARRVR